MMAVSLPLSSMSLKSVHKRCFFFFKCLYSLRQNLVEMMQSKEDSRTLRILYVSALWWLTNSWSRASTSPRRLILVALP